DALPSDALARMGSVRLRHGSWIACAAFAPEGKLLASGGADRAVRLWDPATGKELRRFDHDEAGGSVASSPDGRTLVSADQGAVHLWEVATGKERFRLTDRAGNGRCYFCCVSLSPDGQTLAAGDAFGFICLWEASTGKLLRKIMRNGMNE